MKGVETGVCQNE